MESSLTTLFLKLPRNVEVTPEAAKTFLAALTQINSVSAIQKLLGTHPLALSLEIASVNQQIMFIITCDPSLVPFIQAQLQSNYPLVVMEKVKDPLSEISLVVKELKLSKGNFYPLGTYDKFADVDPLSSILSVLSKAEPTETIVIQLALESAGTTWQAQGASYADHGTKNEDGTCFQIERNCFKRDIGVEMDPLRNINFLCKSCERPFVGTVTKHKKVHRFR